MKKRICCKWCGIRIKREKYEEHLVRCHGDYTKIKIKRKK